MIDFPGSNSLDYHGKTFSICGAMNNLVIVIIPFTGDVSALVSEEVAKVFQVILSVLQKVGPMKTFCGPNSFSPSIVGHGWVLLLPGDPLHQQVRALHQQTQRGVGIGNGSHRVRTFPFWSFYSLL